MSREIRLDDDLQAWLGPIATAIFLEFGWVRQWPWTLTRRGRAAIRVGWGPEALPLCLGTKPAGTFHETSGPGALWWPDRRATAPHSVTQEKRSCR